MVFKKINKVEYKSRAPIIIEQEIKKLQKELIQSKLERQKTPLWLDDTVNIETEDRIGFFNLKKAKIILTELVNGEILILEHQGYGTFKVYMNPQHNRILVDKRNNEGWKEVFDSESSISESNILTFIIWASGDWYILNEENIF